MLSYNTLHYIVKVVMACMRLMYINILAEIINSMARSRLCLYHTKCKIESRNISYYWGYREMYLH